MVNIEKSSASIWKITFDDGHVNLSELCKSSECQSNRISHRHCPLCSKELPSQVRALEKHLRTHTTNEDERANLIVCSVCQKTLSSKSLNKHMQTQHLTEGAYVLPAVPINRSNSIWIVRSMKRGKAYIRHVNLDSRICNGECPINCEHIQSALACMVKGSVSITLVDECIPSFYIKAAGWISVQEKKDICSLQAECKEHGVTMVSTLHPFEKESMTCFSIAAVGKDGADCESRVVVTYHPRSSSDTHRWSVSDRGIHTPFYLTIAALFRSYLSGEILNKGNLSRAGLEIGSFICVEVPSVKVKKQPMPRLNNRGMSTSTQRIVKYTKHILKTFAISIDEAKLFLSHPKPLPALLEASELECFFCQMVFKKEHLRHTTLDLQTRNGTIPIPHIQKKCPQCDFTFRHTDISTGVLMYGTHVFTMDLMVQLDVQMTRIFHFSRCWQPKLELGEVTTPERTASLAYNFFCELVYINECMECPICGPRCGDIAFMDVCGKLKTDYDTEILDQELEHLDTDTEPYVDVDEWKSRVSIGRAYTAFDVQNKYEDIQVRHTLFAAPFLVDGLKAGPKQGKARNSDWKKRKMAVNLKSGVQNSEDIQFLDLETLSIYKIIEDLGRESVKHIKATARLSGIKIGSEINVKSDLLRVIQRHVEKLKGVKEKAFIKFWPQFRRASGGIMAVLCRHGVLYYAKPLLGGEGPSDAVDAMLTVNAKINVYDAIGSAVAHKSNVDPQFFGPDLGLPVPSSEANIAHMKVIAHANNKRLAKGDAHGLVSLSALLEKPFHIGLVDPLHAGNSSNDTDKYLRRLDCINDLPRKFNSMPHEQIWSRTLPMTHSINKMTYGNFMSRFIRNVLYQNKKKIQALNKINSSSL